MPKKVEMPKAVYCAILLVLCLLSLYFFSFVQRTDHPFTHVFYIPIVLAAYWWQWKGVAVAGFLGAALLVSHALSPFPVQFEASAMSALMFVAIGCTVALVDKRRHETVGENQEQETLRRKAELFSKTFHMIPIPMAITKLGNGEFIDINDTFLLLTGYSREDLIGKSSLDMNLWIKSEHRSRVKSELFSGKRVNDISIEVYTKSGKIINLLYSAEIFELGEVKYIISIAFDVTASKRTVEALGESEERLRAFLDSTSDLVFIKDSESRHIFANKALADFFGKPVQEVLGKSDYELIPKEAAEHCRTSDKKALEEKRAIFTEEIVGNKYFETIKFPVPLDEGRKGIGGFIRDITGRKLAEDALHHSQELLTLMNERFVLAVRAARFGVWDWDIERNRLEWDDMMYELYGIKREDFSGAYEAWLNGILPDDRAASDAISKAALAGERDYDTEFRIVKKDGTIRHIQAYAEVIRDAEGKPVRMTGINFDITEQKRTEERIRAGLEEKEALIREIHHRVKNNLQAMISLMHMRGEDIDDEKMILFLKELEEQARTMSLVYEQLYQSSSLAKVDMESYLRQLSSHVLEAFGNGRSIGINLRAESMSFDVALAMPCGLIANELVTNCLKYAFPEGFEQIPAIDIILERDEYSYALTVTDNGIGLPNGFDWQASRTLGLRLVNLWATHQLGGTLDITSGGGMSCTIRFEEQERGE